MLPSLIEKTSNSLKNSFEFKLAKLRRKNIENILLEDAENVSVIENIADYVASYRNEKSFYNLEKMNSVYDKIMRAFKIAMLPFFPASISFATYNNALMKKTYSGLKYQALDKENNVFCDYFVKKIKEHKIDEYDLIYLTCPNEAQIMPSMTFAKVLKEFSKAPIVIGGNIISRIDKELANWKEFFEEFFDFAIIGCGEESVVKLADYMLNGQGSLKSVKGLLYKVENRLIKNKPDFKYDINKSAMITLDGIDLGKYYTPDIIMPLQTSKGCYWGKCTFCGLHCPPKKYTVKTPQKAVDEIEFLNKNYGIKYFEFVDEAIHPKYLSKLADEIIKRNLDIKYVCCARMEEKHYTKDLCEKLYKSGLKLVQFGFESANQEIYKTLNKGIRFEGRLECIKQCAETGIFTYLYAIIGFPKETKEQAPQTIKIIDEHKDIIDFLFIHKFWLDKQAPASKKYKQIGIKEICYNKNDRFAQKSEFIVEDENYTKNVNDLHKLYVDRTKLYKNCFFAPDEYTFFYVLHYGRDKAKEMLCSS